MKDAKGHGSAAHQDGVEAATKPQRLTKAAAQEIAGAAGHSVKFESGLGFFIHGPQGTHGPYFREIGAWKDAARLAGWRK